MRCNALTWQLKDRVHRGVQRLEKQEIVLLIPRREAHAGQMVLNHPPEHIYGDGITLRNEQRSGRHGVDGMVTREEEMNVVVSCG
jgi:hypothetical protein